VCALTAGEGMHARDWLQTLIFSPKRVVVGDNDEDPQIREKMQSYTRRVAEELDAEYAFPPPGFVGVDDWVLADSSAISVIKEWLEGFS
jgi:hypothetical protein